MGPRETQEKLSDQARCKAACRTGKEYIKTGESESSRPPLETEAGTGPVHAGVCGKGGPNAGAPSALAQRRPSAQHAPGSVARMRLARGSYEMPPKALEQDPLYKTGTTAEAV